MRADYQRQWNGERGYLVAQEWKPKRKPQPDGIRSFLAKTNMAMAPRAWEENVIEDEVERQEGEILALLARDGVLEAESGTHPCEAIYDVFGWKDAGTNHSTGGWHWPFASLTDEPERPAPKPRRLTWLPPEDQPPGPGYVRAMLLDDEGNEIRPVWVNTESPGWRG